MTDQTQLRAFTIPPSFDISATDTLVSKTGIMAVPYIMNDWENCNPETLTRASEPNVDCWSHLSNQATLPADRPAYAVGAFGSHIAFPWNEIQTGPQSYDWSKVDLYLKQATGMRIRDAQGNIVPFKPVVIAFSEYLQSGSNPHDDQKDLVSYVPDFVKSDLPKDQLVIEMPNCDTQDMVPYHDPSFQRAYRQFIEAALNHIKNSPYNYVVQAYVMSGGLSHELTPAKNLADCAYGTYYRDHYLSQYKQFVHDSLNWTATALNSSSQQRLLPALIQPAAAWPNERFEYFQTAYPLGIGYKSNSLAPSNANGINARPQKFGLYDAQAMTELNWPKGFEPVYPFQSPSVERCSSQYCDSQARYQGLYWNYLTALGYQADLVDFQKEYFLWQREMTERFDLSWWSNFLERSIGKAANQSSIAWVAFAERFNDQDSFPAQRPDPPLAVGVGDYYPAEFTERGDRDFYLYRLGENEDSTLIRRQAGVISQTQNNYALTQNNCFVSQQSLPNQASKILTGHELRNSGKLISDEFAHPFSATALSTDGAETKTQVSLVLEDQVTSLRSHPVTIMVDYLDSGFDQFALEYTNAQGQLQRAIITKTNSKRWKSYQVTKTPQQISFQHGLTGGADIRLDCLCNSTQGDDIFHMVRIQTANQFSSATVANNQLNFCGLDGSINCQPNYDLNGDQLVDLRDINIFVSRLLVTGTNAADFNCDEVVNLVDFSLLISHFRL